MKGRDAMPFLSLWIPVLVSAVAVFIISSVMHMALKYHRADYKTLPNEEAVREALGKGSLAPGLYHLPNCADMGSMGDPATKAKFEILFAAGEIRSHSLPIIQGIFRETEI